MTSQNSVMESGGFSNEFEYAWSQVSESLRSMNKMSQKNSVDKNDFVLEVEEIHSNTNNN